MARIAGVNIPTGKRVPDRTDLYPWDRPQIRREIVTSVGIDPARRVNDLSDAEVLQIREYIDANLTVEGDLRRETQMNIKRMMDLGFVSWSASPPRPAGSRSAPTPMPAPAKRAQRSRSPARRNKGGLIHGTR